MKNSTCDSESHDPSAERGAKGDSRERPSPSMRFPDWGGAGGAEASEVASVGACVCKRRGGGGGGTWGYGGSADRVECERETESKGGGGEVDGREKKRVRSSSRRACTFASCSRSLAASLSAARRRASTSSEMPPGCCESLPPARAGVSAMMARPCRRRSPIVGGAFDSAIRLGAAEGDGAHERIALLGCVFAAAASIIKKKRRERRRRSAREREV